MPNIVNGKQWMTAMENRKALADDIDRTPLSTFHELIAEGLGQKGDASAC